ncbi:DNA repair protein RecO [Mammaliicoccus fleurettii]|uniref:DNA repair protein RecO n=1 Tax=Mammaliicoccus fleurettii TaxID=150056 RepID=UPI002DB62088|nr:DNA repair protein RecO [Mammaliicoccus fleurettii]MEB7779464.1 DNA repair protein RecO [Mammaliicoccus fleurettii]
MLFKQEGFVIRSVNYGENNKIITILNEHGHKVPLMARGAKKTSHHLQGATQPFVHGLFIFSKFKGMGTLSSADIINSHRMMQSDIFKSAYGAYCIEIVDKALEEDEHDVFFYDLLLSVFQAVEKGVDADTMSMIVALKCMPKYGYEPRFNACVITGDMDQQQLNAYSFKYNGPLSNQALVNDEHAYLISNRALYFMNLMYQLPIQHLNSFTINDQVKKEIVTLIDNMYDEYVGVVFRTKKLLKQLENLNI